MAVLSAPSGGSGTDLASLQRRVAGLTSSIQSIQTQTNTAPSLFSNTGGMVALGVVPGSLNVSRLQDGSITLDVADSSGFGNPLTIGASAPDSANYIAPQTRAGSPTVTQFPSPGNFGWYKNTSTGQWYWTLNFGGTLVFQNLSTLSGTISALQHGNLTGGTLHAAATNTSSGFATAAQITQLNMATSNIATVTAIVTDITSTGTPTHTINGTVIYCNGVAVISARAAAVANSTDVTNAAVQLNALLASLRAINLLSP